MVCGLHGARYGLGGLWLLWQRLRSDSDSRENVGLQREIAARDDRCELR